MGVFVKVDVKKSKKLVVCPKMAYSMFCQPKVNPSARFRPECWEGNTDGYSTPAQPFTIKKKKGGRKGKSKNNKQQVMYVNHHNDYATGPFLKNQNYSTVPQPSRVIKNMPKPKSVTAKLEEKYWAHWTPKTNVNQHFLAAAGELEATSGMEVDEPYTNPPNSIFENNFNPNLAYNKQSSHDYISNEEFVKVEDYSEYYSPAESMQVDPFVSTSTAPPETSCTQMETEDEEPEIKLKHIDSFILNSNLCINNQKEPKVKYQQPKCIRLYKKTSLNNSYVKGGSYPLKSCIKKNSSFFKGHSPKPKFGLNHPGSPLLVASPSSKKRIKAA